jgi:hypothetical protein
MMDTVLKPFRRRAARWQEQQQRAQHARREYDRLRAELSHLEHEIYETWESHLSRSQKAILEEAIRVRCRQIEDRLWDLAWEMWHLGW